MIMATARYLFISICCVGFLNSNAFAEEIVVHAANLFQTYHKYSKQAEPERLLILAREKEEGHLYRSFLPSFDASYLRETFQEEGFPSSTSYGWNLQTRLSLFNGGRDVLEERTRETRTLKATADHRIKEQEVMFQISKAFWSAIYTQSLISTIEKALADNDQILSLAEKRIRSGVASPVDRLDFKLNGIRLRQDLQRAKNELRSAENQVKALLMIPQKDQMVITQEMTDDHEVLAVVEQSKSQVTTNPIFESIQAQSEIEYFQGRIQGRWYYPRLDIIAGYERPSLRQDSGTGYGLSQWHAGLELKINLGEVATSISSAQVRDLETQALKQLKTNTYQLNEASVMALTDTIKSLHTLFHDAEASVKEAEDYVSRILKEYDKGVKNSIDALNATRQSYEARREGLAILRDYKYAIIDYYNLTGTLGGN